MVACLMVYSLCRLNRYWDIIGVSDIKPCLTPFQTEKLSVSPYILFGLLIVGLLTVALSVPHVQVYIFLPPYSTMLGSQHMQSIVYKD